MGNVTSIGRSLPAPYDTFTFPDVTNEFNQLLYINYVLYDTLSGAITWIKLATDRADVVQYYLDVSGYHYADFDLKFDDVVVARATGIPYETPGVWPLLDVGDSTVVWGYIYSREGIPSESVITNTSATSVAESFGVPVENWTMDAAARIPFMIQIVDNDASATLKLNVSLGANQLSPHHGFEFENITHYGLGAPIYGEALIQCTGVYDGVYYFRTTMTVQTNQPDQAPLVVVLPLPTDSEYELPAESVDFLRLGVSSTSGSYTYAFFWASAEFLPA